MQWESPSTFQGKPFDMEMERIWPAYARFCDIRSRAISKGLCDLAGLELVRPATVLPLVNFLRKTGMHWTAPRNSGPSRWLESIVVGERKHDPSSPVLRLPRDPRHLGETLSALVSQGHGGMEYGGRNVFMYLVGELTHNVYDHSGSNDSFIMVKKCEEAGFVEVAVFDDGMTMAGSLRKSGVVLEDDITAIAMAMNGLSAKSEGRRGFGLRTNARMCVRGLGGRILVVSGYGALEIGGLRRNGEEAQEGYVLERKLYHLEGTLVSLRIPFQEREVDLYDYA